MTRLLAVAAIAVLLLSSVPTLTASTPEWSVEYVRSPDGRMAFLSHGLIVPATCPGGWHVSTVGMRSVVQGDGLRVEGGLDHFGRLDIRFSETHGWATNVSHFQCDGPQFAAPDARVGADAAPLVGPWRMKGGSAPVTAPEETTWSFRADATGAECLRVVAQPAQPRPYATSALLPAAAKFPFTGSIMLEAHSGDFSATHVAGTYIGGVGPFDLPRAFDAIVGPASGAPGASTGPAWCSPSLGDGYVVAKATGVHGSDDAWGTWSAFAEVCAARCT